MMGQQEHEEEQEEELIEELREELLESEIETREIDDWMIVPDHTKKSTTGIIEIKESNELIFHEFARENETATSLDSDWDSKHDSLPGIRVREHGSITENTAREIRITEKTIESRSGRLFVLDDRDSSQTIFEIETE